MKEEKFPHTRKPLHGRRLQVAEGGASKPRRRAQQQRGRGQSGEIPAQRIGVDRHAPAREACLGGRGCELRFRLWSERRARTGVGCLNTAC